MTMRGVQETVYRVDKTNTLVYFVIFIVTLTITSTVCLTFRSRNVSKSQPQFPHRCKDLSGSLYQ